MNKALKMKRKLKIKIKKKNNRMIAHKNNK